MVLFIVCPILYPTYYPIILLSVLTGWTACRRDSRENNQTYQTDYDEPGRLMSQTGSTGPAAGREGGVILVILSPCNANLSQGKL